MENLDLKKLIKFYKFNEFNEMQEKCSDSLLKSDENCLIIAPTASGKTVLFDFSIF